MEILKEIWAYLRERKKWWLLPMILALLIVGLFIIISSSALAPFVYTIF